MTFRRLQSTGGSRAVCWKCASGF